MPMRREVRRGGLLGARWRISCSRAMERCNRGTRRVYRDAQCRRERPAHAAAQRITPHHRDAHAYTKSEALAVCRDWAADGKLRGFEVGHVSCDEGASYGRADTRRLPED